MPDAIGEDHVVTSAAFRGVFRKTVNTVAVVTAGDDEEPVGFTATSVTSASLDPPLVTIGVARAARSWPVIARASHLGVHFLRSDQCECARLFAANGADKFTRHVSWDWGPHGIPILRDCMSSLLCEVSSRLHVSESNVVIVAKAVTATLGSDSEPLTYRYGQYNA